MCTSATIVEEHSTKYAWMIRTVNVTEKLLEGFFQIDIKGLP